MAVKKSGLGRGLTSLFDENSSDNEGAVTLNLNDIEPNRDQPRKDFDETALSELADSIAQHGLIQPIVVKPNLDGRAPLARKPNGRSYRGACCYKRGGRTDLNGNSAYRKFTARRLKRG